MNGHLTLLREADFGPLRSLIAFEDGIYDGPILLPIEPAAEFHRVVVMDIDDEAIGVWNVAPAVHNGTPRYLIASILRVISTAGTSTVLLDFDFRNQRPEDTALRDEIAESGSMLILLSRSFNGSGATVACSDRAKADAPLEYGTPFDSIPSARKACIQSLARQRLRVFKSPLIVKLYGEQIKTRRSLDAATTETLATDGQGSALIGFRLLEATFPIAQRRESIQVGGKFSRSRAECTFFYCHGSLQ
jgi:hypothetical protein